MTEKTKAIAKIKQEVSEQEWQQRIVDCRNSKMSTKVPDFGIGHYHYNPIYIATQHFSRTLTHQSSITPSQSPQTESA